MHVTQSGMRLGQAPQPRPSGHGHPSCSSRRSSCRGSPMPVPSKHAQAAALSVVTKAVEQATAQETPTSSVDAPDSRAMSPNGTNGANGAAKASSLVADKSRVKAVAAKISAARELARRLAEEKQAAAAALKSEDKDAERLKRSTEEAAAQAAAQAARADALARQLRTSNDSRAQLNRLRTENEALKELLFELASDRRAAQNRLAELQTRVNEMVIRAPPEDPLTTLVAESAPVVVPVEAAAAAAAVVEAPAAPKAADKPTPPPAAAAAPAKAPEAPSKQSLSPVAQAAAAAAALFSPLVSPGKQQAPAKPAEEAVKPPAAAKPAAAAAAAPAAPVAPPAAAAAAPPAVAPPAVAPPAAAAVVEAPKVVEKEKVVEKVTPEVSPVVVPPPAPASTSPPPTTPPTGLVQAAARAAEEAGEALISWPTEEVRVGSKVWIYYNRTDGPLPQGAEGLQLKAGLNKWEELVYVDMKPCKMLDLGTGSDWWEASLELPTALYKFDFVIMDLESGAVDNNEAKDFNLRLVGGPTETELMEQRAAEYASAEIARKALLMEEENRLWAIVQGKADQAAAEARQKFRERRVGQLRDMAVAAIAERRRPGLSSLDTALEREGVFKWIVPSGKLKAGSRAFLAYNTRDGPFNWSNEATLHFGYDGWYNEDKQIIPLKPLSTGQAAAYGLPTKGTSWCGAEVDIPATAYVVDFVFSDLGQQNWDNNENKDFHTQVADTAGPEAMQEMMYQTLVLQYSDEDKLGEERAARRARKRVEAQGLVARRRREAQQEFLYTMPIRPQAGQICELYYNPDLTPLRGRPEIYVRGAFNRWQHPNSIPATQMKHGMAFGVGFMKTQLQVPEDAHVLDVVFSDSVEEGGFYDNNGGLDYHIPIEGAKGTMPGLKVVHVAVEMAPIAKVGGMGDVVTALARAVQDEGHSVEVVVPKYDVIDYSQVDELYQDGGFQFGGTFVRVWRGMVEGLATIFLEPENGHFWRQCIYGRGDDHVRFSFFCGAAQEYVKVYNVNADVMHCHDWQTAPVAWGDKGRARSVFTIHNLNYGSDLVGRAMAACDVATTVSPTYAREISGHPVIAPHLGKLFGIRNGIDEEIWDPSIDEYIPRQYISDDVVQGKAAARRELRRRLGLSDVDVPVVSVVTRLVHQKGIHLIKHAAWRTLERGGQFVLLGSAPDGRVQGEFNALKEQLSRQYPDRAALYFAYDEPLSHLIYAASDMFLVPSMFEPCGLTQMVAMRYGTVPVVRRTGGLNDTVFDVDHDDDRARDMGLETNGFSFDGTDTAGMDYALNRALSVFYSDRAFWNSLAGRIMNQDWSWDGPALDYLELYYKALKGF